MIEVLIASCVVAGIMFLAIKGRSNNEDTIINIDFEVPGNSEITHGLIIKQPWIELILNGDKHWEMRSTKTSRRGPVALIEQGTGQIVGVSSIDGVRGPLTVDDLLSNERAHCVPSNQILADDYKWYYCWQLGEVSRLETPINYVHKSGAVIWVELDEKARSKLHNAPNGTRVSGNVRASDDRSEHVGPPPSTKQSSLRTPDTTILMAPIARDGTQFTQNLCNRAGSYTVGDKGAEQKFRNYHEALAYLKRMSTARWRRPNSSGNWGIVSAVRWEPVK